jgi:hypothetical protein
MKTITFLEIDGFPVIKTIENAVLDPAETQKRVTELISQNPGILSAKTETDLIAENIVFARLGSNQKQVNDAEGQVLAALFNTLAPHEKLLLSGEKVLDLRGTEYWIKQSGNWNKHKIEELGQTLPPGAVLPETLSRSQRKEIDEQAEVERVAVLTPEEKMAEMETALASARHEIRIQKEDAEAVGEPFDAPAEYQSRKTKIEEKYA